MHSKIVFILTMTDPSTRVKSHVTCYMLQKIREKSPRGGLHPFYKMTLPDATPLEKLCAGVWFCGLFDFRPVTCTNCRCDNVTSLA